MKKDDEKKEDEQDEVITILVQYLSCMLGIGVCAILFS